MSADILKSASITNDEHFDLKPDADARLALAEMLGIRAIRKLGFSGMIGPDGPTDLTLEAKLGATVVQDCVVTGQPVTTRIDETVQRHYIADMQMPDAEEAEMPEDDTAEPLPAEIRLSEVMSEALALALPPWPRADGVDPVDLTVTEPGKTPMSDEDAKPFAGLKDLKARLEGKDD